MSQGEQFDCSSTSDCEGVNSEAANLTGEMWSNPKKSPRRNVTHRRPKQEEPGSSKTDSSRTSSTESDLVEAPIKTVKVDGAEYILVGGPCASFHGHYDRDDGMGTVDSLAQTAVEARVPFWAVTPHNHKDSRNGVPPDDPRYEDQKGKPNIVDDPDAFAQLRASAQRINSERKTKVYVGQEMGTISKTNHMILLDSPTFYIADLEGNLRPHPVRRFLNENDEDAARRGEQRVVHYRVQDGKALVDDWKKTPEKEIVLLCHPDKRVPQEKGYPEGVSPIHYFMNCYSNQYEWSQEFGRPYIRGIGVLQGMALTKGPVEHMNPHMLELKNAFGYNDTGIKPAFLFELDNHYGKIAGRPAGMGILEKKDDKDDLDGLESRRTFVSTKYNDLQVVTIANDKYVMGDTIDPKDIDKLRFKVLIGGRLDRNATYNVKLFADTELGDTKSAKLVEQKSVSGRELLNNSQEVRFDDVQYKSKNGNAFVMQVERAYTSRNGQAEADVAAATTTIWVESPDRPLTTARNYRRLLRQKQAAEKH